MSNEQQITGQANGHNGIINYEVDVSNNHIDDFKVLKHSETPGIFNQVVDTLKQNIIANQSFDVDTISGATVMTQALLNSAKSAINAADVKLHSVPTNTEHQDVELTADVVVIGGGEAGLVAASRALSLGHKVILVEKNGYLGGATILNGSNVTATGSKVAARIFPEQQDSPEQLFNDVTKESRNTNLPELTKLMVNNICSAIDFVSDYADLTYQKAQIQTPEHSVERQIELPSASSFEFIKKVSAAFKQNGGQILLDAHVENILTDDNRVTGLVAEAKNKTITIHAQAVVLAAGGYGANQKMRGTESEGIDYYGPMTSTGDAYSFNDKLNLKSHDLGWYKVYPHGVEVEPGIAKLTTYASKKATDMGAIYVNNRGQRIVNESDVYAKFRDAILDQPGKVAFMVMDERTWKEVYALLVLHDFTAAEIKGYFDNPDKKPVFVKGGLREVAQAAGINSDQLVKTVQRYQEQAKVGEDPDFGRDAQYLHQFDGETFYVVEQRDRFATTLGGYSINPSTMQLKNTDDQDVTGYYAAGEIVGGANGHDSMPSMMNTWGISSGYLAGLYASQAVEAAETASAN